MSAIGHRLDKAGESKFTSKTAIRYYLEPTPVGCALHDDPNCLCDVKIDQPVEAKYTPAFLARVENEQDLVMAGMNLWLRLDVMGAWHGPPRRSDRHNGDEPQLPPMDELRRWEETVRSGATYAECRDAGMTERSARMMRALVNVRQQRMRVDDNVIVGLLEEGLTVEQVRARLRSQGTRIDSSTITKAYKRVRGHTLNDRGNARRRELKMQRIAEAKRLYAEGMSRANIARTLGVAQRTSNQYIATTMDAA